MNRYPISRNAGRSLPTLLVLSACLLATGVADAVAKKHKPHAPAAPSLAKLQALQCAKYNCDANTTITKLTVLKRGPVHRGSGATAHAGGDGIAKDTWIYPLLMSYDETVAGGHYEGNTWVVTHSTSHVREKDNVLRDPTGAFVLRFVAETITCDSGDTGCTAYSVGGGA